MKDEGPSTKAEGPSNRAFPHAGARAPGDLQRCSTDRAHTVYFVFLEIFLRFLPFPYDFIVFSNCSQCFLNKKEKFKLVYPPVSGTQLLMGGK